MLFSNSFRGFLPLGFLLQIQFVNVKVLEVSEVLFPNSFKGFLPLVFLFQLVNGNVLDGSEVSEVLFSNSFRSPLPLVFLLQIVNLKQIFSKLYK